ncbi:Murein DD-endopeptidase MepM and murein hydrolase activator NlpD, contain LysM domain [Clostridium sp. USBA 49]|uniref:M23 family metallopeptidase n=1 Tax=Clostridium sp. USBA 49 TaxID=1881060 RepID=UPI00099A65C0|nr:M23 family metallopeptidase [Clostridium sp. USBA 49]SKA73572.1 Murein DD-endopeptidase MepM and murein hydrolase activator NlpD, contain LysM domain [Clostridium sp. USBA 49]
MFNKRVYKYTALSAAVIVLVTATAITSSKNKISNTSVNNVVLTDKKSEEKDTANKENNSNVNNNVSSDVLDTSNTEELKKDTEVKINTYTVKSGDTLDSIAAIYNVKVNTISESNGLSLNASLKDGQVLEFPSIDGVLYKIKEGETLWDLALLNKVDINKIIKVNNLENPEKLKLNQKIIIPDISSVKSPALNASLEKSSSSNVSKKTVNRGGSGLSSVSLGSSSTNNSSFKGSLPVSGSISSKFGERWGKFHKGIDIAASTGTNVYAFADGKVIFSGLQNSYGNLLIIDHGNGFKTYYAHNSKLLVSEGQVVEKGDHIAEVGSTGNSTGSHCHFEIRKNDSPVNPLNYIK